MVIHTQRASGSVSPPPRISLAIRAMLAADGEVSTAERLGVSRTTLIRLAGRLPCRKGSVLQAAHALGIDLDDGVAP